jgi:hypothetical protein
MTKAATHTSNVTRLKTRKNSRYLDECEAARKWAATAIRSMTRVRKAATG